MTLEEFLAGDFSEEEEEEEDEGTAEEKARRGFLVSSDMGVAMAKRIGAR